MELDFWVYILNSDLCIPGLFLLYHYWWYYFNHTLILPLQFSVQFSSVTQSCLTLQPHGLQHARLPCPSPTLRACSNSCSLSQWCHPTIWSSVIPFSCLQSFPASEPFPRNPFFTSGGQSIGSFSFSISPSNEYSELMSFRMDWLGVLAVQGTLKSLLKPTVQKHQFFCAQLSL